MQQLPLGFNHERMAEHVLDLIRGAGYQIVQSNALQDDGSQAWRLTARTQDGQTWTAQHGNHYSAVILLAQIVGVELDE